MSEYLWSIGVAMRHVICLLVFMLVAHAAAADPMPTPSLADIVERTAPSVVVVTTDHGSVGAGFVAFGPRQVITNHHVIAGSRAVQVRVVTSTGAQPRAWRVVAAVVQAVDAANDLALLQVQDDIPGQPLALVPASPRVGESVLAIGNPGVGSTVLDHTVSNGIVSASERQIEGRTFLQTTAAINPGNSGGPLLDLQGRVIGVVTAKAMQGENIGFVVPASLVQTFWNGRNDAFRLVGDLATWERVRGLSPRAPASAPTPGNAPAPGADVADGIAIKGIVTDLAYDAKRKRIFAVGHDSNRLYAIDPAAKAIVSDLVVGSAPIQFAAQPGGFTGWVVCQTSKSAVNVNLDTMKQVRQVPLSAPPLGFTLAGSNLWIIDTAGGVFLVRQTGGKERRLPIDVRSIAYYPKRTSMLAGSSDGSLWEIDEKKILAAFDKLAALDDQAARTSDPKRLATLDKEAEKADAQIDAACKKLCQPAGTRTDFASSKQALIVDPVKGRIFFNRSIVDYHKPDQILGVFQQGTRLPNRSPEVMELVQRYPWLDQVRAVSVDGRLAASGTFVYRTDDFTVVCALPIPATAVAFDPDGQGLWYADPIHQVVARMAIPAPAP